MVNTVSADQFGLFGYTDNGTSITITGYPRTAVGAVSIPSTIAGKPVITIGQQAFAGCYSLTSITIPAGVTTIGDQAFNSCTSLTGITIPAGVTIINDAAFSGCSSLTSITIPAGVTLIYGRAFSDCSSLTSITIPAGVTSIGSSAFWPCPKLTAITVDSLNATYSSLDGLLFNKNQTMLIQCPGSKPGSVTIPAGVTTIGTQAFSGCAGLTSITIPSGVTSIQDSTFSGCAGLTSITIPAAVTTIGNSAFSGCTSLLSITIPDSVTTLGYQAFNNCSSLLSVTIPGSVTTIGDAAFEDCASLTSITIPAGVISIGNFAFASCHSLTSVTIPGSVSSIGRSAFSWCRGLTNVTILAVVVAIQDSAFSSCPSLTSMYFMGNAPTLDLLDPAGVFSGAASDFKVYYYNGRTGFTSPTWYGYPSVMLSGPPIVTTPTATSITAATATLGGNVTSDGGTTVTARGVVYSPTATNSNPLIGGIGVTHVTSTGTTGVFTVIASDLTPGTTYTYAAYATNNSGASYSNAAGFSNVGITDGIDQPGFVITNGTLPWFGQTLVTHDHVDAAQSGAIGHNQESWMQATLRGPGALTFWWRVSSETGFDYLEFYLDGTRQSRISGTVDWNPITCSIPSGTHTVKWRYAKDQAVISGSDAGWVDQVSYVPAGTSPVVMAPTSVGMTSTAVTLGGTVTDNGGQPVTTCGVVYAANSTNSNPRIGGSGVTNVTTSGTTGAFTVNVSGLTPNSAYTFAAYATNSIGTSYSFFGGFTTNLIVNWLEANGFPASTDLLTDPNSDGVNLLMAYALNLNPTQNLSGSLPRPVIAGNQIGLTFFSGSAGVTYTVETSSDLQIWSATPVTISAPDGNNVRTATVPATGPNRFMRLVVGY